MVKKIHVWLENEKTEIFLAGCFDLNDVWSVPRGIFSSNVKMTITYEEVAE